MSYWTKKEEQKRCVVDLPKLYNIMRRYDIMYYSVHLLPQPKRYILYLYDYDMKYICECHEITNLDIRMLRKIFINLFAYSDEIAQMAQIFGTPK